MSQPSFYELAREYVQEVLRIPEEDIPTESIGLFDAITHYDEDRYAMYLIRQGRDIMDAFWHWERQRRKMNKDKIYLFTFTLSPKFHPVITEQLEYQVEKYIEAIVERKLDITHLAYVKELHKSGRPHWHALVISKRILKKDRFITFIKKFGNIDISRNKAQKMETVIEYISKTGSEGVKWVLRLEVPEDGVLDPSGTPPNNGTNANPNEFIL